MRIMSVIGAAALALMCLAFPTAAAPPNDHLAFDVIAHGLAVAPVLDASAVSTDDLPDMFVLTSTSAADEADGYCDGLSDTALKHCLDQLFEFGATFRRYDPGWRSS